MNNFVVVDASIALKWSLTEPDSSKAIALLDEWRKKRIVVIAPALLIYDANNILYRAARAGKITLDAARDGIDLILKIARLDFSGDSALNMRAMEWGSRFGLPASYDAHYLALAEQQGCELWTSDTRLWRSVKGHLDWVRTLENYSPSSL